MGYLMALVFTMAVLRGVDASKDDGGQELCLCFELRWLYDESFTQFAIS